MRYEAIEEGVRFSHDISFGQCPVPGEQSEFSRSQRTAPFRPYYRIVHGAASAASGPLRPSTQIADAALQPVEADLGRERSILGSGVVRCCHSSRGVSYTGTDGRKRI